MDILNYCEAYANYLSGFTVLWYELFGPHYDCYCYDNNISGEEPSLSPHQHQRQRGGGEEGGLWDSRGGEAEASSMSSTSGEWTSSSSPSSPAPPSPMLHGPQVPPHLYAVRWSSTLTPQRRAWFEGLHNVVKELLVRILSRELPLELYALFIQYANLSLRVYLLQMLAEVFECTSNCLDVLSYVHVMRQSYNIQCEMSELQRIWASFGLFDSRFIDDCREFNKTYTESQGAFSEQQMMVGRTQTASAAAAAAAAATSSSMVAPNSMTTQRSPHSDEEDEEEAAAAAAVVAVDLRAVPSTLSSVNAAAAASTSSSAAATSTYHHRYHGGLAAMEGGNETVQRFFSLRGAINNASGDAEGPGLSSASSSPDDDALSSASEAAAGVDTRTTKRAVYLPLFYTCCCFTWILQRSFWSMYGRCSLLLENCLGSETTPQILRVGVKSVTGSSSASVLFSSVFPGARRRGSAAAGMGGAAGPSPNPRATPTGSLTRTSQTTPTAVNEHNNDGVNGGAGGGGWRATPTADAAVLPSPSTSLHGSSVLGDRLGNEGMTRRCTKGAAAAAAAANPAARPLQVPRTPFPQVHAQPPLLQHPQQASTQLTSAVQPTITRSAMQSNASKRAQTTAVAVPSTNKFAGASEVGESTSDTALTEGAPSGLSARWSALLSRFLPRRHRLHPQTSPLCLETRQGQQDEESRVTAASTFPSAPSSSPLMLTPPHSLLSNRTSASAAAAATVSNEEDVAADALAVASASATLTCSGAPFYLQYTNRIREMKLYEDPSASFIGSGNKAGTDAFFFEEFQFLRETGCYVLSHALRSLTCYPRYPVTLLIITDNTHRPGRVAWRDHKFSVLASYGGDSEERRGLAPWVLCAIIPHTRLSSDGALRAQQEERLLQHVVFQVAGAKRSRVRFCTPNSVFYALNSGADMDGGRLYFVLHLHVPHSLSEGGTVLTEQVMREESRWAFRELGELHCSWAMPCTCNEALRVAFQVGPVNDETDEM
jgi:hypothetical protein